MYTVGDCQEKQNSTMSVHAKKRNQQAAIAQLKEACKNKDLTNTVVPMKIEPSDSDSCSSESDEHTTKTGQTGKPTEKPTQKPTEKGSEKPTDKATQEPTGTQSEKPTAGHTEKPTAGQSGKPTTAKGTTKPTSKSCKDKPTKPSTIDCDKDHTVTVKDDNTISGVIKVGSCHATRFQRKPTRCGGVGNTFGSLVTNGLNKNGIKGAFNVNIVKTVGDAKQTEFHYECPCAKANQQAAIAQLKEACKSKDLVNSCTNGKRTN